MLLLVGVVFAWAEQPGGASADSIVADSIVADSGALVEQSDSAPEALADKIVDEVAEEAPVAAPAQAGGGVDWMDWGLWISYILGIACAIAALILPLVKAGNPKALLATGINLAVLLVIFGIAYMFSEGTMTATTEKFNITEGGSKIISAVLTTVYILFFGAAISIVYGEVSKLFK